jgi:hypothetical protein
MGYLAGNFSNPSAPIIAADPRVHEEKPVGVVFVFDLPQTRIVRAPKKLFSSRAQNSWSQRGRSSTPARSCATRPWSTPLPPQQGALALELRTATSPARLRVTQGRHGEAEQILTSVYHRFTEGFDTLDLKAAKELLSTIK